MAEEPDALKRLDPALWADSGASVRWLLRLTRALLESQGELLKCLEDEHESEFMGTHGCTQERPGRPCSTCSLLTRAEAVRRGEGL